MEIVNKKKLEDILNNESVVKNSFNNLIIDHFLDDKYFKEISSKLDFMEKRNLGEKKLFSSLVEKKEISLNGILPTEFDKILKYLSSDEWVLFLSKISNIQNVYPAMIDNSKLANFHQMDAGGYLGPHVDHSNDPAKGFPHVLNVILYLTPNWKTSYGGDTIFFDKYGKQIIQKIEYQPNRLVIFLHSPYTFHGVTKINDNCKIKRSTMYFDYYSKALNPYKMLNVNFKSFFFKHGTTFILPKFRDYFKKENKKYLKSYIKYKINKFKK